MDKFSWEESFQSWEESVYVTDSEHNQAAQTLGVGAPKYRGFV